MSTSSTVGSTHGHPAPGHGDDPGATAAAEHLRTLFVIYGLLMLLLVLTIAAAFVHLGWLNIVVAMAIATTKAVLVVLWFMHVLHGGKLVWAFAASSFIFLAILLVMTFGDYMSRNRISRGQPFDMDSPFARQPTLAQPAEGNRPTTAPGH